MKLVRLAICAVAVAFCVKTALADTAISAWDAAEFRIWGFVPDWTPQSQVTSFSSDGVYDHVSDVLYFGGVRPTSSGNLVTTSAGAQHLSKLKAHAATHDFRLHMSMFTVSGGSVDDVWNSIVGNSTNRANFVSNVVNLMDTYDMSGFNLDWERPSTDTEWANYTQLAKDLKAAFGTAREVSVDDFGFSDSDWDDTPVFDARTYDQLFIMGYHYPADNGTNLDYESFAAYKRNLTDQGVEKAFVNEQLVPGIGTWGTDGPATVSLKNIVAANPNLPADATTFTGSVRDLNGTLRTGTWTIESRYQVRDKVQFAIDNNMPGVMSWTLHYDATNEMSLHRVAHHYAIFATQTPDLNLDGLVDQQDANILADHMGSVPGWTGTNTLARFENFYMRGNWEQGDHDGNGFVRQDDADWLADRFTALGLTLPDRLAYTGTFENFADGRGTTGRWLGGRDTGGALEETGNFTQHTAGYLSYTATGIGAAMHSTAAITIRNQNAAERYDQLNTAPRTMEIPLETPIDLGTDGEQYFTMLVRQNTDPLLSNQLSSPNRELALQFLDAAGDNQFDIALHGQQQQISIRSQADSSGEDVSTTGFAPDTTFMLVGRIAGNGAGENSISAALLPAGANIGNFASDSFAWDITANNSADFNPVITKLGLQSLYEGSFTVSNVWIGTAADYFALPSAAIGDFNGDGLVDLADYSVWRNSLGISGDYLPADADGNGTVDAGDYAVWKLNFGTSAAAVAQATGVPEPHTLVLVAIAAVGLVARRR
ncbi:glycosyl hydrolase family 18 protein [Aeoliella sp. ICT_H6.2]|uniref:Glycosyl hydrolase family 18 protein n=1 Tax=Aeoliella straminimaris TaxID=2954799 RepID=A0A9X2FI47_9BACT|nr:glycosyl hydrolase family 18 protein [Aeoliella straminimaris]MCO6046776.1 glycosyl hydrolase family 18 protein [Aeoliella straminimaris]